MGDTYDAYEGDPPAVRQAREQAEWESLPPKTRREIAYQRVAELDAAREMVNHPDHYGGDTTYEAVKVIEAWGLGWHLGDATKYIARAGKKFPEKEIEDLEKALWYIQRRIKFLKEQQSEST